mmetsp:Transcript_41105/g.118246  ORF Transcript_41105/g.118246 Transcript_41105/m.118246 type:complete len:267 (+) Transcript_41105:295-1095(+)
MPSTLTSSTCAPSVGGATAGPPSMSKPSGKNISTMHTAVEQSNRTTARRGRRRSAVANHEADSHAAVRSLKCQRQGPKTLLKPAQPTCKTLKLAKRLSPSCSRQQLLDNSPAPMEMGKPPQQMPSLPPAAVSGTACAPFATSVTDETVALNPATLRPLTSLGPTAAPASDIGTVRNATTSFRSKLISRPTTSSKASKTSATFLVHAAQFMPSKASTAWLRIGPASSPAPQRATPRWTQMAVISGSNVKLTTSAVHAPTYKRWKGLS